jgi:hypothetical protein
MVFQPSDVRMTSELSSYRVAKETPARRTSLLGPDRNFLVGYAGRLRPGPEASTDSLRSRHGFGTSGTGE